MGVWALRPLGLTIGFGLLVARAAAILARSFSCEDSRDVGVVAAAVAVPYAVLSALLALIAGSGSLKPSIGVAFLCAAVIGGLAATIGAFRGAGQTTAVWGAMRADLRLSLQASGTAGFVLLGAATLLAIGSVLSHSSQFGDSLRSYRGASGQFSMILLSLFLLPNAIIFALSYIVGPGFAIGSGTSVAYGGAHVGATPALPLLAAVPTGKAPFQIVALCLAVLVVASVLGGWRIAKAPDLTLQDQLRIVLVSAVVLGVGAAALTGIAGGSAGPGRLREVGPSPWQVGLTLAGEMAVVAGLVVLVVSWSAPVRDRIADYR